MYSITENIYCSQLSSVALLLQPERNCFTLYNTRKGLGSASLRAIVLRSSPPSHVSACNGQRSSQLFCIHYTGLRVSRRSVIWTRSLASGYRRVTVALDGYRLLYAPALQFQTPVPASRLYYGAVKQKDGILEIYTLEVRQTWGAQSIRCLYQLIIALLNPTDLFEIGCRKLVTCVC
jgi:hypothetical protein